MKKYAVLIECDVLANNPRSAIESLNENPLELKKGESIISHIANKLNIDYNGSNVMCFTLPEFMQIYNDATVMADSDYLVFITV